ncbi:MAG: hypothetical protein Q8R13_06185 [bacterium]|nr:hypothetical protein [bacterium]MDZ4296491.1 hypothetical protein [Patescibacteria group bacterium]
MTDTALLAHLEDPFRRSIAVRFAQHELRKLLPAVRDERTLRLIDEQVEGWYDMLSVRNFWNGIHGMSMGFRLKSLVPWITSLHIRWSERECPVDELWFGGGFGLEGLGAGESAKAIRERLFLPEHRDLIEEKRRRLLAESATSAPRDHFPIFVVRKEGKLRVIDGNRRLLNAVVAQHATIGATIGEQVGEPALYEHWVPTALLVDLVFWHDRYCALGRGTTDAFARTIAELIRDSRAGRDEFVHSSLHRDDASHMRLLERVAEILVQQGVAL